MLKIDGDNVQDYQQYFVKHIAPSIMRSRMLLGEFLNHATSHLSSVFFGALSSWLRKNYHLFLSYQRVALRVFLGEMSEEQANLLPCSMAVKIAVENLPDPDKSYLIFSPDTGAPIKKKFRNFTRAEIKLNLGPHGIKSLSAVTKDEFKPFAIARASSYRVEGDELILVVNSLQKEIHQKITEQFIGAILGISGRKVS